jgi:hypothetical protein
VLCYRKPYKPHISQKEYFIRQYFKPYQVATLNILSNHTARKSVNYKTDGPLSEREFVA